jgi:hypothetical protein
MENSKIEVLIPSRLNFDSDSSNEILFCRFVKGRIECSDTLKCENKCVACFNRKTFNIANL